MRRKYVDIIWLGFSIFFFLMLSVSFLLMPLESENPTENISSYTMVAGLMFWISIIMAIVIQCVLLFRMKKRIMIHSTEKKIFKQKIGLVSFFKNVYAAVADVTMIVSLICLIIAIIITKGTGYICYVFVSLLVFSFSMHCILNGKIYYHVINQNKILRAIEKERGILSK